MTTAAVATAAATDPTVPPVDPERELALALGLSLELLSDMPAGVIEEAMGPLRWDVRRKAAYFAAAAIRRRRDAPKTATDASAAVVAVLAATESERKDPWRATWRQINDAMELMAKFGKPRAVAMFAELSKQGQINESYALMLQVLLLWTTEQQTALAAAMLNYSPAQVIQIFNATAALREPEGAASALSFVAERGATVVQLAKPLWPREKEFAALMLQQLNGGASGGAPPGSTARGFGAGIGPVGGATRKTGVDFFGGAAGGGVIPVGQAPDGTWAVDVTPIEEAYAKQTRDFNALKKQVVALERQKASAWQPDNNVERTWVDRGRGRGSRGDRSRGRGARGGEADDVGAPPPPYATAPEVGAPPPSTAPGTSARRF